MPSATVLAARDLVRVLVDLGIRYVVGGSMASSVHAESRSTLDVDVALQLEPARAAELERALQPKFWVHPGSIVEAAELRSQCNVIHRVQHAKADLYVRPPEGIYASEIERAVTMIVEGLPMRFASAEDTILQKLAWFRAGDEVSERQWRDVVNVIAQAGVRMDRGYLDRWAPELGIQDLLERAIAAAREDG